jgi:hypothetical protein
VDKLLPGLLAGSRSDGQYVSFTDDALSKEFLDWLAKRGVPSDSVVVDGKQHVIWHGEGTLSREFFEQRMGAKK